MVTKTIIEVLRARKAQALRAFLCLRFCEMLFMVLANRYDWQLFLEVTGPGGSGKSVMASIATLPTGKVNTTSATIETLESSR